MILAKATWTEVEALDREQIVVVPVGGIEPHGLDLPLGTSTLLVEELVARLERTVSAEILVTPTMPFGVSGYALAFAGTLDIGHEAFIATLRGIVHSLRRYRFRRFLVLAGINEDTAAAVTLALRTLKNDDPFLSLAFYPFPLGGAEDGSMLLAVAPGLVRDASNAPRPLILDDDVSFAIADLDEHSPSGMRSIVESRMASRGEHWLGTLTVDAVAAQIRRMREGIVYVEERPGDNALEQETIGE